MSEAAKKFDQTPEGYSPKERPAILELADSAVVKNITTPKAAAATIANEERNFVRIVELPACKMVTSGPANGPDIFGPDGVMTRFNDWFSEFDKNRTDKFYPRDFMWSPAEGGFEWGYAVGEVPKDTAGFEMIDFPGGLYAVAISVDADGKDHNRVYKGIQEWVEKSGCFMLDETEKRRSLGNITSPMMAKEVMGYHQMDLYFPIRIKEESK
jgi:AraC family transcriptional regulator